MPWRYKFLEAVFLAGALLAPFSALPVLGVAGVHVTVFRVYVALLVATWVAHVIQEGTVKLPPSRLPLALVLGSFYWLACSALWAEDPGDGLVYLSGYGIFILVLSLFICSPLSRDFIGKFINAWLLAALLIAILAVFEVSSGHRFVGSRYLSEENPFFFRPTATFFNENGLAVYLALSSLFIMPRVLSFRFALMIPSILALTLFLWVIFLTQSRGALLVVSVAAALLVALRILGRYFSPFMLIIACALLATISLSLPGERAHDEPRLVLLGSAFLAMQQNYLLGVGVGGVHRFMSSNAFSAFYDLHNWLGEMAAVGGLVGFGLWIFLFIVVTYRILAFGRAWDSGRTSLALVALTFPFWQSIVSSMAQFAPFWLAFMACCRYASYSRCVGVINAKGEK